MPIFDAPPRSIVASVTVALLLAALLIPPPAAAVEYAVTSANCTGPGSLTEAMADANANPGADTISIPAGLTVDATTCPPPPDPLNNYFILNPTESVIISGAGPGASIVGKNEYVDAAGLVTPLFSCPSRDANNVVVASTPGLLTIGEFNQDNSAISVTVRNLKLEGFDSLARIERNASLTIEDATIDRIFSVAKCDRAAVDAKAGANFTARNTHWDTIVNWGEVVASVSGAPAIAGDNAGDLTIEDSTLNKLLRAGAIQWLGQTGSEINIVSSAITYSNGIFIPGGHSKTNIVNSLISLGETDVFDYSDADRIVNGSSGEMDFVASTILFNSLVCEPCENGFFAPGSIYRLFGGGKINFRQSAIGVAFPAFPGPGVLLDPSTADPAPGFSADVYTWMQPTVQQGAADLRATSGQPGLLTAVPGLPACDISGTDVYYPGCADLSGGSLTRSTPVIPGELIETVLDAATGGINELFSPVDGLPITVDIYGRPRVYANGTRNTGAVQSIDAPTLSATPGDAEVSLGWAPTPEGQQSSYEICTSSTPLTDPLTGACPGTSSTAGASETAQTIPNLTNGSPYWFAIRVPGGIWSNVAIATPLGKLGIAQPIALAVGDGSLRVDWIAPTALGGYTGQLSYNVVYRPIGSQTWVNGPQGITALTTTLIGLTNGTTYEIGVLAQTTDGGLSPTLGTITGTPQAAPTLSYATPSTWPQNTPLTLNPSVAQLQGTGTYSIISGSLPTGITLNTSAGVVTGTPTTQQTTSAIIRLTDGSTGLYTDATMTLIIVPPSPSPQLWYPAIQATVGSGPVSATPTQSNIPAGATYSVVADESLPAGFSIDASTGIVSGTPTSTPGQVLNVDIQACWGGCDPNAGEVRIAPALFYILPRLQYPANTNASAGVALTINPTVDLWSGGQFSILSGSLPAGMSLNPTTGVISAPPQTPGNAQVTIRYSTGVNVAGLEYVSSTTQINVTSPTITLTYPPVTGVVGQYLSVQPNVIGLTGTPVYTLVSGLLPQGLSLNSATGAITGVPTDPPGSYPVVIEVTDPYGSQRTSVVIEVQAISPIPVPALSPPVLALLAILLTLIAGWAQQRGRRGQR